MWASARTPRPRLTRSQRRRHPPQDSVLRGTAKQTGADPNGRPNASTHMDARQARVFFARSLHSLLPLNYRSLSSLLSDIPKPFPSHWLNPPPPHDAGSITHSTPRALFALFKLAYTVRCILLSALHPSPDSAAPRMIPWLPTPAAPIGTKKTPQPYMPTWVREHPLASHAPNG